MDESSRGGVGKLLYRKHNWHRYEDVENGRDVPKGRVLQNLDSRHVLLSMNDRDRKQ